MIFDPTRQVTPDDEIPNSGLKPIHHLDHAGSNMRSELADFLFCNGTICEHDRQDQKRYDYPARYMHNTSNSLVALWTTREGGVCY